MAVFTPLASVAALMISMDGEFSHSKICTFMQYIPIFQYRIFFPPAKSVKKSLGTSAAAAIIQLF